MNLEPATSPAATLNPSPWLRSQRRWLALGVATLVALTINVCALTAGVLAQGPGAGLPTREKADRTKSLLLVPGREADASIREVAARAAQASPSPATPRPLDTRAASARSAREEPAAARPTRFYRLSEVDVPAQPSADWNIDLEALDKLGLTRLAFEVLVDERGVIVSCTILDPPALAADLRAALESRLHETPMTPAWRHDVRVPSVRRIELFVSEQTT